jgi:hypothetical protein
LARASEQRAKARWCERSVLGLWAQLQVRRRTGRVVGDGTERARVGEHHPHAVGEVDRHARVRRQRRRRATEVPVTGHAEVREQRGAVGEVNQLVLASAFDARDGLPCYRALGLGRQCAALGRMMGADAGDGAAREVPPELSDCEFDFGKFRHRESHD